MRVHGITEHACRHAGHGRACNSHDAGGARLPVDCCELAEEIARADIAEDHLAAAGRGNKGPNGAADDEKDVRAAFAAAQYLLLGVVPAPEALFVQGANIVVRQTAEERDVPKRCQLPRHDVSVPGERRWLGVSPCCRPLQMSQNGLVMFMVITAHPFKGGALMTLPDDLKVF